MYKHVKYIIHIIHYIFELLHEILCLDVGQPGLAGHQIRSLRAAGDRLTSFQNDKTLSNKEKEGDSCS